MENNSNKRPREQPSPEIKLNVKGQDGMSVLFLMPRTASMEKLLQTFCRRRSLDYRSMRFFYNGERFLVKQSPDQLGMEDHDEIEAMTFQAGGGYTATKKMPEY